MSTLTPGLSLHGSVPFKQICNKLITTIEYADDGWYSDVEVSDNKLVRRSIDNGQYSKENPYSAYQVYIPNIEMETDLVGDTEMISTFIDKYNLNVNWIHWWENVNLTHDIAVCPFVCSQYRMDFGYLCLPPHKHTPRYIWTRYPQEISELSM